MRQVLLALLFLGLVSIAPAQAGDAPAIKQVPGTTNQSGMKQSYLGLGVEPVPPALSSQLSGIVPRGQGVLVARVAPNSPAAKAALQSDDILLSYGDQKLSSPEQLVKLVRNDKPGHQVALSFVRGGKAESCKVTLGERELPNLPEKQPVFRWLPDERLREMFAAAESKNDSSVWDSFDALKLTRLDAKRWRAEIEYRSKEGKKEHKTFEGTRETIRKDVQAEKDLPANERTHLLRALDVHEPVFEFHFPPFDKLDPIIREQL